MKKNQLKYIFDTRRNVIKNYSWKEYWGYFLLNRGGRVRKGVSESRENWRETVSHFVPIIERAPFSDICSLAEHSYRIRRLLWKALINMSKRKPSESPSESARSKKVRQIDVVVDDIFNSPGSNEKLPGKRLTRGSTARIEEVRCLNLISIYL